MIELHLRNRPCNASWMPWGAVWAAAIVLVLVPLVHAQNSWHRVPGDEDSFALRAGTTDEGPDYQGLKPLATIARPPGEEERTGSMPVVRARVLLAADVQADQLDDAPEVGQPRSDVNVDSSDTAIDAQDAELAVPKDPTSYGLWVLAPAAVAILLAIFARQVVPALILGVLVGAYMYIPCLGAGGDFAGTGAALRGIRLTIETYIFSAITDPTNDYGHINIIVFTLTIGFTVGVIGRNGGTAGLVRLVAGNTESRVRGTFTAWLAGMVVFFDDYANTMIIGPTMRSIFDRLRLSRAKLAYIVDSTAAPVASLALIGTWIGAEISYIDQGLEKLGDGGPLFLEGVDAMSAFLFSIPYRFYAWLALFFVFIVAVTGRDFGPMKRSEREAFNRQLGAPPGSSTSVEREPALKPNAWLGLLPILVLVGLTIGILIFTGYNNPATSADLDELGQARLWEKASVIISNADSYVSILYGAVASAVLALLLTMTARVCSVKDAVEAGLDGMARMFPAIVILVLAWSLSQVSMDLKLGDVITDRLTEANFRPHFMPAAIFVAAALISFATGTSWGTMGILCPVVVQVMAGLGTNMPTDEALPLFYSAVGSVLAGAIFGDHCSPISDTTVLSSLASGCSHEEHVWTQLPYAIVTAIVALLFGDLLCGWRNQPWYVGLLLGAAVLLLIILLFGRRPRLTAPVTTPRTLGPRRALPVSRPDVDQR